VSRVAKPAEDVVADGAASPGEGPGKGAPQDVIHVRDQYYVLASSSLADGRTLVLKQGETFAVFDRYGDLTPVGRGEQGLYHEGCRHLSRLELRVDGRRPILLSSTVTRDNALVRVDLTNPELGDSRGLLPQDTLHLLRSTVLNEGACHQSIQVRSYATYPVAVDLGLRVEADFADVFEVRGIERPQRGTLQPGRAEGGRLVLAYRGLDGVERTSWIHFTPRPAELNPTSARFRIELDAHAEATVGVVVTFFPPEDENAPSAYGRAASASKRSLIARASDLCEVRTSRAQFDECLGRSTADLRMMLTETPHGTLPFAGVPWFDAPFGRDSLITALELLWAAPSVAGGVLRYLAATQATQEDPSRDAEPGKIVHEVRRGEMAALGEVPFDRYYGTVDATPLFVLLAGAYLDRTDDWALIEEIWPALLHAMDWIRDFGDRDGDGFIEYGRRTPAGLANQGWKDSGDSVFHQDGGDAMGPIALCEVQAYAYGALVSFGDLAARAGERGRAEEARTRARSLAARFEEVFWSNDRATYAMALDGRKRPCTIRTSNAGHCLLTGLVRPERARKVAAGLVGDEMYSGWGIRTLGASETRYNPISYHNGSVWPHDNALISMGLARYGLKEAVLQVFGGLFDACLHFDLRRMPELFCGFPRRPGQGPTLYPVACAPQAWAAGAFYALLQASLGLGVSAVERRIVFTRPMLPPSIEQLTMKGLRVGEASVDLHLRRHADDVGVEVRERRGDVEITIVK